MINDKLPDLHQPLVDVIRKIAPDVTAEVDTTTDDRVFVHCTFGGRSMTIRHDSDGEWTTRGYSLATELDLVEKLVWLVDAPRVAGPADVDEMKSAARDQQDAPIYDQCSAALHRMDSAAILACSRALPNNDWRKHTP